MTTKSYRGATLLAVSAALAIGTLTSCSQPAESATVPESARYIAEIPAADGHTMAVGIAVDDGQIAAYATDGSSDEAWFFGAEHDGVLDMAPSGTDHLSARFDGATVAGDMSMGDRTYTFTARQVVAPAGVYTATAGDARATWVVDTDGQMIGMMMPNSRQDREVIDQINKQQQDFKDGVRQRRQDQLSQAPQLTAGTWQATMNGTPVMAIPLSGNMRF